MDKEEPIKAEIVLYQDENSSVPVEVRYLNETFWLTQEEIASLFAVDRSVISKHLKNIYESDELVEESTCAFLHMWVQMGKRIEPRFMTWTPSSLSATVSTQSKQRVSGSGQLQRSKNTFNLRTGCGNSRGRF